MKRVPLNELTKAVYSRLTQHLDTPVYDDVPPTENPPYITVGLFTCKDTSTKVNDICDVSVNLDIWSDYRGKKEVNEIANDVITVMMAAPFGELANGFFVVGHDVDFFESFNEDDYGYHGALTFIFKVQNMEG